MRHWASALAFLVGLHTAAAAQATDGAPQDNAGPFWVNVGLGVGTFGGGTGTGEALTALGQFTFQTRGHMVRLRGAALAELFADGVGDIGILYGRGRFGPESHTAWSVGLGFVYFEDCPDGIFASGPCRSETTVGLPLSASATWRPAPVLGIGGELVANLNSAHSFVGAVLTLELGALRQ